MGRRGAIAATLATALALTGCGKGRGPEGPPTGPGEAVSPFRQWVAVFRTAGDPNDLDALTRELMEEAGPNIGVGPAGCWRGLADELGITRSDYVAGVVGRTEERLAEVVEDVGREPILRGEFILLCD